MQLTITIFPNKIAKYLTVLVVCLVLISVAGQYCRYVLDRGQLFGLIRLFDVNQEQNIPTWYSSSALMLCSALLAAIASSTKIAGKRYARHWLFLSLLFIYLSIDEASELHEQSIDYLRSTFNAGGFFHFSWVIMGWVLVILVLLSYWKFLLGLPTKTRNLFFLAGGMYLCGALGMEMVGGYYADLYGEKNLNYALITHVEEFLEMMGIVAFIYALLSYMRSQHLTIRLGKEHSQDLVANHSRTV